MKSAILLNGALAAYLLSVIWTFGHAANNLRDCSHRQSEFSKQLCRENDYLGDFFSALFWPFYWSVQLQKGEAE